MLLFRFQERIRFLEVIVFIIAIGFLIASWHVQVIFYSYFAFGLYFLYFIVAFLVKKNYHSLKQLGKSLSILVLATVIALLMSVDMYWQIYEYTATSTRGTKSIIEKTSGQDAETASGFYDYATSWSFSPGEVMTFVIPSFYGFGDMTYSADGQDVEGNVHGRHCVLPWIVCHVCRQEKSICAIPDYSGYHQSAHFVWEDVLPSV
jgi:hypothetical protein